MHWIYYWKIGQKFLNSLTSLQKQNDSLEEAPDIRVANVQPHQWWSRVDEEALSKIAKRVLALTCSASLCERNWRMYSFVYNKSRNRLGTKKAEDLVYIYTNTRLLRGRLGANPL